MDMPKDEGIMAVACGQGWVRRSKKMFSSNFLMLLCKMFVDDLFIRITYFHNISIIICHARVEKLSTSLAVK